MKWLESTFIKRDLGVSVDCKLNMNHHLDTVQRETPYWDYKQKYNLQDTERNLSAQLRKRRAVSSSHCRR